MIRSDNELLNYVKEALREDKPLYSTMGAIEKQLILRAAGRHRSHKGVYRALKIPKSSYYIKKKALNIRLPS